MYQLLNVSWLRPIAQKKAWSVKFLYTSLYTWSDLMIKKASIYTMNALNKSSELWLTSVNRKARPVVEGEHDKSWNDHGPPGV